MKYRISYTLNMPGEQGYKVEYFKTKKAATAWLKENESTLYWYKFHETFPKSKKPKPIVNFDPSEKFEMKTGKLGTYFETGMECLGLVFNEDGIYGPPNPSFDPDKPEGRSNFKNFASYDALNFIKSGDILQIEDGPKIAIVMDRDFASRDGCRLSVYPQGFSVKELMQLFQKETVKAKLWIKKESK